MISKWIRQINQRRKSKWHLNPATCGVLFTPGKALETTEYSGDLGDSNADICCLCHISWKINYQSEKEKEEKLIDGLVGKLQEYNEAKNAVYRTISYLRPLFLAQIPNTDLHVLYKQTLDVLGETLEDLQYKENITRADLTHRSYKLFT